MKQYYRIGTVLRFKGKNYEVKEGNGDDCHNTCGKCAMYGGAPGLCKLSKYEDLKESCSSSSRPDGKDIHYVLTDKRPFAFYGLEPEPGQEEDVTPVNEVQTNDEPSSNGEQLNLFEQKKGDFEFGVEVGKQILEKEEKTTQIMEEYKQTTPKLNVVKAKDLEGKPIEGVLITTEDGSKFIMPYGTKVQLDGSCNLIKFDESTLSYMTRYRDMNGRQIYTGDELKVVTLGNFNQKYNIRTVDVKKRGVVPLFYIHGTNEHSDDVAISGNDIINGYVVDCGGESELVSDWFSAVMNTVSKTIGNGSDIGTEEYKTLYKMYLVDDYLKKQ